MKINEFSVTIYGDLNPYNEVASKARVRIFYKYGNRNGTWITDEFAEGLLKTLPYATVGGIYSEEEQDFQGHGLDRAETKIYGIVPENPNVSWEKHLDIDGIEREYACADVLLFTARYPEASKIIGKSQSMELYNKTLTSHKEIRNGLVYCVFDSGSFLGLQALGDTHEPCFQGAAFYSEIYEQIDNIISTLREENRRTDMMFNFKLSDDDKFNALWTLLNSEADEEGNKELSYCIMSIYDDYALVFNCKKNKYERAYYTKNDKEDSVVIDKMVDIYIMDITEDEKTAIDTLRTLNGDTFSVVNETLITAEENCEKLKEADAKIEEYSTQISTLTQKIEEQNSEYTKLTKDFEEISTIKDELVNFKAKIDLERKEAVIAEYSEKLSSEILDSYHEKIDDYTELELDKELAYELKKSHIDVFSSKEDDITLVPKEQPLTGVEEILSRYKK